MRFSVRLKSGRLATWFVKSYGPYLEQLKEKSGIWFLDARKPTNHPRAFFSGDVLYGKFRPYLDKVCQPPFDGLCSTDILVFDSSRAIENEFLLRLLTRKETRDALETNPDLLDQLRQSILAAAFRGDLTRKWREQHKGQI